MAMVRKFRLTNPAFLPSSFKCAEMHASTSQSAPSSAGKDVGLTEGRSRVAHFDSSIYQQPWARRVAEGFGEVGENAVTLIAEGLGRKVNANEHSIPTKAIMEYAERFIWRFASERPLISRQALEAHSSGDIYYHKLPVGFVLPYCNGNPISRVIERGFDSFSVRIRPPKRFQSAVLTTSAFLIFQQGFWTGAQGTDNLNIWWAPFFEHEIGKLQTGEARALYAEYARQIIQSFLYEVNMPYRTGGQSVFSNIAFVMYESRYLLKEREPVLPGGRKGKKGEVEAYLDTATTIFKLFLRELLNRSLPFTYPVNTIYMRAWGPNYKWLNGDPELWELFWHEVSKFGNFYFLNTRHVSADGVIAMCCRMTQDKMQTVDYRVNRGGVFSLPESVGSLNIASLNLPRYALQCNGDFDCLVKKSVEWTERLGEWLIQHHRLLEALYPSPLYSGIRQVLTRQEFANYFATVGILGLPEALVLTYEDDKLTAVDIWGHGASPEDGIPEDVEGDIGIVRELAKRGRKLLLAVRKEVERLSEENSISMNVEQVPAETASSRLFWLDWEHREWRDELRRALPPDRSTPAGVLDMYSNFNTPSWSLLPFWELVDAEAVMQPVYTGGVMRHFFFYEKLDEEALAKLVQQMLAWGDEERGLVYFSISPARFECANGHSGPGIYTKCPVCGAPARSMVRIVGWPTVAADGFTGDPNGTWSPARARERRHRVFLGGSGLRKNEWESHSS